MNRRTWLLFITGFALALAAIGIATVASASMPAGSSPAALLAPDKPPVADDGFDALPPGLKGVSYSTLAMSGRVHPQHIQSSSDTGNWKNPFAPSAST